MLPGPLVQKQYASLRNVLSSVAVGLQGANVRFPYRACAFSVIFSLLLYMLFIASIPLDCPVVRASSEIRQLAGVHDARQCRHWRAHNATLVYTYHCMSGHRVPER